MSGEFRLRHTSQSFIRLKQMKPTIQCRTCRGTGKEEVPEHLRATLLKIGKHRKTAKDLLEEGLTPNAIMNRLEDLCVLGLIAKERAHRGEPWIYFRTTQP